MRLKPVTVCFNFMRCRNVASLSVAEAPACAAVEALEGRLTEAAALRRRRRPTAGGSRDFEEAARKAELQLPTNCVEKLDWGECD